MLTPPSNQFLLGDAGDPNQQSVRLQGGGI